MNFYIANKQTLESALKNVYRQKEIVGQQSEKTIINAGEAVWSQIISPNFNTRNKLPFMWYENSGFDVYAATLEELKMQDREKIINPKSRSEYEAEEDYPYVPMNFKLNRSVGSSLLLAGVLAPPKEKFEHAHINNYFYTLFGMGLKETNPFWTLPIILHQSSNNIDRFILNSIDALASRVIATYMHGTINFPSLKLEVIDHMHPESELAKQKIAEMSSMLEENNPVSAALRLYEEDLKVTIDQGEIPASVLSHKDIPFILSKVKKAHRAH
ncbi:MAG TPA: hypothetical protein VNF06_02435 [Candidatus Aquilonibacter sp.]|nr:hypothetical protein [Candidatus Aquilonibacter sp.]